MGSLLEDYEELLEKPISYKEFREKYIGDDIPSKHQYDLFLLVSLHHKEIKHLREKLEAK